MISFRVYIDVERGEHIYNKMESRTTILGRHFLTTGPSDYPTVQSKSFLKVQPTEYCRIVAYIISVLPYS